MMECWVSEARRPHQIRRLHYRKTRAVSEPLFHYSSTPILPSSLQFSRVLIVVLVVPLRDIAARRAPNTLVRAHIVQRLVEIIDPKRHADDERMKRQAEHAPARGAVFVKRIEVIANHAVILLRRVVLADENADIVDAQFIWHDDHSAAFNAHRRRLLVVAPVANVFESLSR